MKHSEHLDDILVRSLSNELNSEEHAWLLTWLSASDENKQYYESLKNTWQLTGRSNIRDEINIGQEWAYFQRRVQQEEGAAMDSRQRTVGLKWTISIAAAASVLFVIGLILYWQVRDTKGNMQTVQVDRVTPAGGILLIHKNNSGMPERFLLSDSSEVILETAGELTYLQPFAGNRRDVYLTGEARFHVAKDAAKPFTVFSGDIATTALGTQFTVTAFAKEPKIRVALHEGKVVVKAADSVNPKLKDKYYLLPGDELVYDKEQKSALVRKFIVRNGNNNNALNDKQAAEHPSVPAGEKGSWYMFNNQRLSEVFRQLEQLYGVEIVFSEQDVAKMYFIGKFSKTDSLVHILKQIATLNDLTVTAKNNKYYVGK